MIRPEIAADHPIFMPFKGCKNKEVIITTWGIVPPEQIQSLVDRLGQASNVTLVVGYSKISHNLDILLEHMLDYRRLGWYVLALPNCHVKLWQVGGNMWVGSANLCFPSLTNIMVETDQWEADAMLTNILDKAANINETSDLRLLKQLETTAKIISL